MSVPARLALGLLLLGPLALGATPPREVRDDTGAKVRVPADNCRLVSLAPGTTAMLFAVGAGDCLVGTIAHSKEPAEAASVPVIGDSETLDFERLLALRPSTVVVAVDVVQRVRIDRIRALGLPVYEVHVTSLRGMPQSLRRLGAMTGTPRVADARAAAVDRQLDELAARYRDRPPLRVLYQIWDRPIYTIGGRHVISDALTLCGASNVFADLDTAAPAVTREAAVLRDPDVILLSGPPAAVEQWRTEWRRLPALTAVKNGRLLAFTDERMDRMGPAMIDAVGQLCATVDRARELPGSTRE